MSQTSTIRKRAILFALFTTALFGAVVSFGVFGAGGAQAQSSSCDISDFVNPGGGLDTTGYLACVQFSTTNAPRPTPDCPTADIQLLATATPSTVAPGQTTQFSGVGFAPGSTVEIFICGGGAVSLGTFSVDENGNIIANLTIPAGTSLGDHTLVAVGVRANGISQVAYAAIVVATQAPPGQLPRTGGDNGRLIAIGAALVVLGAAAVYGSTRSRQPALAETD